MANRNGHVSAAALRDKLNEVNIAPVSDDVPAETASPPAQQQVVINPERQMMLRMWLLEDEVGRLTAENARLQEALAKAGKPGTE